MYSSFDKQKRFNSTVICYPESDIKGIRFRFKKSKMKIRLMNRTHIEIDKRRYFEKH